jgi:peptidoglycan/LPS O-acetylase OafA/YrhL
MRTKLRDSHGGTQTARICRFPVLDCNVTYRSDIDGLRAVSVLAVVAFHLNGFVPGGYVGVDVFFVISGFLIGSIVFGEIDRGTFSFGDFYKRRVRRLAPALVVTLLGSYAAAVALMAPLETTVFAKSSLAALFSAANIFFYATSGYFGPRALDLPLLHLWSLGIEEQFYIVFPVLAVVLSKYFPRALIPVLVILGLSSLLWSQMGLARHPEASFYLLQSRAFELTIGVLLARLTGKPALPAAQLLSVTGAALLSAALFLYSDSTRFPGLAALAPCLGTALIIWSGRAGTVLSRMLAVPPLVYLGKISYPLYLVHWPLIVFGRIVFPEASELPFALFVVTGSFLSAAAIYHLVERPIRSGAFTLAKTSCLATAASISMIGAAAALLASGFEGRPWLRTAEATHFVPQNVRELFRQRTCFLDPDQGPSDFALEACLPAKRPEVILWGDSHAAHHFDGLKHELDAAGYSLGMFGASACPPIVGRQVDGRPFCKDINDFVLALVNSRKPDIVVLSAFWKPFVMDGLEKTVGLLARNDISVVVLGNTPIFEESVPTYLSRPLRGNIKVSDRSAAEIAMRSLLEKKKIKNVRYISLQPIACPSGRCALTDKSGHPYYFDEGHLTQEGSRWIAGRIISDMLADRPRS